MLEWNRNNITFYTVDMRRSRMCMKRSLALWSLMKEEVCFPLTQRGASEIHSDCRYKASEEDKMMAGWLFQKGIFHGQAANVIKACSWHMRREPKCQPSYSDSSYKEPPEICPSSYHFRYGWNKSTDLRFELYTGNVVKILVLLYGDFPQCQTSYCHLQVLIPYILA